jgi:hypothetical protein
MSTAGAMLRFYSKIANNGIHFVLPKADPKPQNFAVLSEA